MNDILRLYSSFGNELDTARMYCDGNTEEVLCELQVQKDFKLATKAFPFKPGMHSPELLEKQFMESLDALGSKCVDIFYLHAPDHATPFEDTLKKVDEFHKLGYFKELGLSNYAAWNVMEIYKICEAKNYVLPTVYQGRYSVLTRDVEPELFPCLRKLNIRFYAYNPLCGGLLAGKLKMQDEPDGRFATETIQGKRYRERYWNTEYFTALEEYKAICDRHGIRYVEAAHRWIMNHSQLNGTFGDAVIIGASSFEQAKENFEDCQKGTLPEEMVATFDKLWKNVSPVCPRYAR
ncbi:Aflatoxin B1 aldehyde reductase member 2 [Boothiomyces sp. JEL0838]|nr:Aflatoxin B1 aldehyde reductase member 2 [Boothiomyces sp. JEL0838]